MWSVKKDCTTWFFDRENRSINQFSIKNLDLNIWMYVVCGFLSLGNFPGKLLIIIDIFWMRKKHDPGNPWSIYWWSIKEIFKKISQYIIIICFYYSYLNEIYTPKLSVISQPTKEIGRVAGEMINHLIQGENVSSIR